MIYALMEGKNAMKLSSLRTKIILSTAMCILIMGVISYTFLYRYLTDTVSQKAQRIDTITLESVQRRINTGLKQFFDLCNTGANDYDIARGILSRDLDTAKAKSDLIRARDVLAYFLSSSGVHADVNKLMVFNEAGVTAQGAVRYYSYMKDYQAVQQLPLFQQLSGSGENYVISMSKSILYGQEYCMAMLCYVDYHALPAAGTTGRGQGWLYAELGASFFEGIMAPYPESGLFVLPDGEVESGFLSSGTLPPSITTLSHDDFESGREVSLDGSVYRLSMLPLSYGLNLYACSDITPYAAENREIIVTVSVVALTSIAVVLVLAFFLAYYINKPLTRLTEHIARISENHFEDDLEIEKGGDEIAQVGKVVNEMTRSIRTLLNETEDMYRQQKDAEIALLQSQVNPHFLYNTLDSIRWMAIIQNNPGIAKTVSSLSSLLKNLAKGVGDKITLGEELSLLNDYAETQSVRFMELFEIVNDIDPALYPYRIIKFTLQPLVENAIFHGIEPSGRCGTIRLDAREEEGYLLITIEDDGVGMDAAELAELLDTAQNPHPSGMAGIGIANVHNRLRLVYGSDCGLTYESEKGAYTRVTVRIPKEV